MHEDKLPLEMEHYLAETSPQGIDNVPNDVVEDFFWAENYGAAQVDDSAFRKRFDRRTAASSAAPGTEADPLQVEENFEKAFSVIAKEIRSMIRSGNWTNYVRNTVAANPEMAKAARQELVDSLKESQ